MPTTPKPLPTWLAEGANIVYVSGHDRKVEFGTIRTIGKRDVTISVGQRVERFNVNMRTDYDGIDWLKRRTSEAWSQAAEVGPVDSERANLLLKKQAIAHAYSEVAGAYEQFTRHDRSRKGARALSDAVDAWLALLGEED